MENIIMFLPVGAILQGMTGKRRHIWFNILVAFTGSLCIEIAQIVTGRGVFHADDLIANTAGAVIGLCLALIFNRIYSDARQKS